MAVWSSLCRSFGQILIKNSNKSPNIVKNVNFSISSKLKSGDHGHREMAMQPSRFQWNKFKDMLHYYVMVGAIPCGIVIMYCNIFIGPAELQPIPEDYVPKHWEYSRHPITRFMSRYVYHTPQQDYEKFCHFIFEEREKMKLRQLEKEIKAKMAERQDFQAYYFKPITAKYVRLAKEQADAMLERMGDE